MPVVVFVRGFAGDEEAVVEDFGVFEPDGEDAAAGDAAFDAGFAVFPALTGVEERAVVDLGFLHGVGADAGEEEVFDVEVMEMEVVVGHAEDGTVEGRAGEGELGDGDVTGIVQAAEEVSGAVEFFVIGFRVGEGGVVGAP